MMTNDSRAEFFARQGVLRLISDDESSVCGDEPGALLSDGEEYLDLRRLAEGVRRAQGQAAPVGHVLPRRAVHEVTWTRIVTQLAALPVERGRYSP